MSRPPARNGPPSRRRAATEAGPSPCPSTPRTRPSCPVGPAAGAARRRPAHRRARRHRRDRPQHDRLRVRGPAARRRLRGAVPRGGLARRRPDPARLPGHRGPPRRHRRARAHARPRGPHRRGAVPAAAAPRPAGRRLAVHARAGRGQVPGAPAHPAPARGGRGRPAAARHVRTASTSRSTTRSPTRWPSPSAQRPGWCCTPATSSSTSCRSTAGSPTSAGFSRLGDEGVDLFLVDSTNAEVPGFVIAEREIGPVLDGVFGRSPVADHRGLLRQPRAPRPAGARRRRRARAQGGAWSAVRWCATWASPPSWASSTCPRGCSSSWTRRWSCPTSRCVIVSTGSQGEPLSALATDGPRRSPLGPHPRPRTRHPRQLVDPGQRDRRLRRDQRARPGSALSVVHQGTAKVHVSGPRTGR